MNVVILKGRLTKDVELRRAGDTPVCNFTIAVDKMGGQGADFIDVVAWKNTAEFISKYFGKGKEILVQGRLQVRDWTDKQGNKRRAYEVNAHSAEFCGKNDSKAVDVSAADFEDLDDETELPF